MPQNKSRGTRYNQGKLRWGLADMQALEPMVQVLMFGATKYADHNWKKGLPTVEILESMQRHINAYLAGEDLDEESGISHVGHIQCNAMFLGYNVQFLPEMDNRYKDPHKQKLRKILNKKK